MARFDGPLENLRGKILLHAGSNAVAALPAVAGRADGVIFHGHAAHEAVELIEDDRPALVLHDPDRYSRQKKNYEVQSLFGPFADELNLQQRLDVDALLSPSVLPAQGDTEGLAAVFSRGSEFLKAAHDAGLASPGFIAVCASPYWLLGEGRPLLDQELASSDEPVALVLADWGDPLRTREAVEACLELIELAPDLMSIRCDLSAIGLVANGAIAGAVGASTAFRHLYLPRKGRGRPGPRRRLVFVFRLMAWHDVDEIALIHGADELFACPCAICEGADVRRFARHYDDLEALLHQTASVRLIASEVLTGEAALWPAAWEARCRQSRERYEQLAGETGVTLLEPAFLTSWLPEHSLV